MPEVEPEEAEERIPPIVTEEEEEEPSVIEKAYRIQYSSYILKQLAALDHIEIPSGWLQNQYGTLKDLDKLSVYIRNQLRLKEEADSSESETTEPEELKSRLATLETLDEPSARLRERLLKLNEKYLNLIEKYFVQFGYDLFRPEGFPPPINIVLPDNYILGPGDILRINMWGSEADVEFDGIINPDGTITLPKLGVIPLTGVRYGDVKKIIAREAQKYIQGINLNVTVLQPKSLEVYIVGQVKNPGLTVVPAFSTVLSALVRAGGPLKVGSLRNIVIFRKGKFYRRLDLYDIMLKGDISNDVLLENKDVVHVPYIGPTVAVVGAVRRPAIFEIKDQSLRLDHALALAGRAMAQAQAKINVRRFMDNRTLGVLDVSLGDPKISMVHVQDGDLVEVRYIEQKFPRTVRVTGHVWDPVELAFHEGMRISEVIPHPERLKPKAITDYALLRRYVPLTTEFTAEKILL
ncbi:MAG: polysaccharide export protein, partial [Deltaproteobacteria bacterium]|nr:polysaccharide export protein [Deltaproteobacteria bacterium]